MRARENTYRFNFFIDLDLLADLRELQHKRRLPSVTAVIHELLTPIVAKELGKPEPEPRPATKKPKKPTKRKK